MQDYKKRGKGETPNKNKNQLAGCSKRGQWATPNKTRSSKQECRERDRGRLYQKQEAVNRGVASGGSGRPLTKTRSS